MLCSSGTGRTLVLEQENKGPLGWLTVTTFAASHPEDIRCELSKDGSRIVRIKSRFANLENEDCLALQSKRLFPDAYAYDADDPELENEEVDTEERGLLRLRKELERGIRYIDETLPNVRQRRHQIKLQRQNKLEEERTDLDEEAHLVGVHGWLGRTRAFEDHERAAPGALLSDSDQIRLNLLSALDVSTCPTNVPTLSFSLGRRPQVLWSNAPGATSVWAANVKSCISNNGTAAVLAFNEPDQCGNSGSCIQLPDAVSAYQTYMMPLAGTVALGAPAVINRGRSAGLTYLKNFLSACTNCHFAFFPIHWYSAVSDTAGPRTVHQKSPL
ncbi:MAG: hypothetical protein FRX48_03427 [Lasallia pustulata]|uniref:Asl1-like glycosyl hydrolase catalytic domain-containing protein n=1 Tax=Lasallia pustulata TaxID=136370 RepID=A0A5M8PTU5_9LECA|nr:MAG: hypothetical protein FRX48_03427 [Lasallia pustulata]